MINQVTPHGGRSMTLPIAFVLMCANAIYLHGSPTIAAEREGIRSTIPVPETDSTTADITRPTRGVNDRNLRCVNDYLFTVNCSLTIKPTDASLDGYRLLFRRLFLPSFLPEEKYVCQLLKTDGHYYCSFKTTNEEFSEMDYFEISLCQIIHDGSEDCTEVLDDNYTPAKYITPNAPCSLIWNASQYLFSWRSGYEKVYLHKRLMYQLHFYNIDHKDKVETTHSTSFSVNNTSFAFDTEYTLKVRSSPYGESYRGQWSEWSAEVYWKTQLEKSDTIIPQLDKNVIISLCVLAPLLLFLGFAPVIKARLRAFIPTPESYFESLYSECQGDFKSWVVTPSNDTGLLKAEETLQIDTLIKHTEEEDSASQTHRTTIQVGLYCNIIPPDSDATLRGLLKPEGIVERDSGCSLCSATSMDTVDRDNSNYCTLSDTLRAFQTPGAVMVELQHPQSTISKHDSDDQNQYLTMKGFISAPDV